jgi:hypothetical protein
MNIKQMAVMLADEIPHGDCYGCGKCHNVVDYERMKDCCQEGWLIWLESEVMEE